MNITVFALALFSALAPLACEAPARSSSADSVESAAPTALKIDSILPPGEALRRFQSGLPSVAGLSGGEQSRDALVRAFITAIESNDTAALGRMLVSKAEYAFLYFPTSVYSRKPYELPPDIAWLLSEQNTLKGRTRVTRRMGGKSLRFRGYECGDAVVEGDNRFWRTCRVSYVDPTTRAAVWRKLFGAIIERDGAYKFLSYGNDF